MVELDGSQHYEDDNVTYDRKRTEWLMDQGLSVIRFDNSEIFENMDGVLQTIYFHLSKCQFFAVAFPLPLAPRGTSPNGGRKEEVFCVVIA